MTQDDPKPSSNCNDFIARYEAHERRNAALLPINKVALFEALIAAGITTVAVRFDGYGDNGQIEEVVASAGDVTTTIPDTPVELARARFDSKEVERQSYPLAEAINMMVYALLEATHGGWENNEGAFGDFVFDVSAQTILLEFNYRIEAIDSHSHAF